MVSVYSHSSEPSTFPECLRVTISQITRRNRIVYIYILYMYRLQDIVTVREKRKKRKSRYTSRLRCFLFCFSFFLNTSRRTETPQALTRRSRCPPCRATPRRRPRSRSAP